jgi:hypothetical protein
MVDEAEIVKQRRDVKKFGIEFQLLTQPLHGTEDVDSDGMVEKHVVFVAAHQFSRLARQLAVGDFDAGNHAHHLQAPTLHFD